MLVIKKNAKFASRMEKLKKILLFLAVGLLLQTIVGCKKTQVPLDANDEAGSSVIDLTEIEEAGELICVTLNGPDTYYEFHGRSMGVQYLLAESFANKMGLRLRMEVARDTVGMIQMLKESKADIIACKLPASLIKENKLQACGVADSLGTWSVNDACDDLAQALNEWYSQGVSQKAQSDMAAISSNKYVRRRVHSVFSSKSKGVVSNYDMLFLRASKICGWDWKLIASQCYQESGFDAEAVSWAGARGLMQIMPSTASSLGVRLDELFDPEKNLLAAARYIKLLEGRLGDIVNPTERKKFVLASYNGGLAHIKDAMTLARKYGRNPHSWDDVSYFVLHLSEPRYYRDPVVKSGYMIGRETFNYVNAVMSRWNGYHAVLHNAMPKNAPLQGDESAHVKRNRFSSHHDIIGRDDSLFNVSR